MSQINPEFILNKNILIPCEFTKIQQIGIDLTISQEIEINNGASFNVLLNETVKLSKDIYAILIQRSSYNRKGILITGSIYDPGYWGVIGCTIYNLSGKVLHIDKNERICQMVFFNAQAASEYSGQYQKEHLSK